MKYLVYFITFITLFSCSQEKVENTNSIGVTSQKRFNILEIEENPKHFLDTKSFSDNNANSYLLKALCWSRLQQTDSAYHFLQKSWSYSYNEDDSLVSEMVQAYILFRRNNIDNALLYLNDQKVGGRSAINSIFHYRALANYYILAGDILSAIDNTNSGLKILKGDSNMEADDLLVDMELNLVALLIQKGDIVEAISILDELKYKLDISNESVYSVKSDLLLARIHGQMGNDEKAFEYLFPALESAKKLESVRLLVDIYSAIASVFLKVDNTEKALEYLNYGIDKIGECGVQNTCGDIYLQFGHIYLDKGEHSEALIYFKKALDHFHKNNNALKKAWSNYSIGRVYLKEGALTEAGKHFNLAEDITEKSQLSNTISFVDLKINTLYWEGKLQSLEGKNSAAVMLYEKAYDLAQKNKYKNLQIVILNELSSFYELNGNTKLALENFRELERIKQVVRNEQKTYMVAAVEYEYQSLQNRQKIDMQETTLTLQRTQITQVKALSGVLGFITIICIIALIVANNFRKKRSEALAKLEEQNRTLETKTEELQQINGFKDQLISVVGHDLRSPIGMLKTSLDFLVESADELPKEDILKFMTSFQPNVTQTYNMINNLLVWAQSQQGRLTIEKQNVTLGELMEDEIAILNEQSSRKNINLNVTWDNDLSLYCDKPTISTALRNIISNALKFTPEGGEVKLDAVVDGTCSCIEITDSGIGMDDKLIHKILNGEKIVSEKGTNDERGTGLGLVICKEFIVKNDGEMKIKSKKGEGTTISVYVPSIN